MKYFCYILLTLLLLSASCSKQPSYQRPLIRDSNVVVDITTLRPDVPVFYTYRYLGRKISFFVIKIDGKVLSFFDACENCHHAKLGYRFDEGFFVCRLCNVRYPVSEIEKGIGSCFPFPLTGRIQNGQYLIHISMLEKMVDKF
ncbi:MAG TPA: hypothetical protein DDX85_13375 [Nitrospiraceae bacterium]|nr:hypothetical protein [Nitrospiraceae bacterium]